MKMRREFCRLAAAAALVGVSVLGFAQSFPARPVKIVIPWPAGGNADITTRALAADMQNALGQTFVIENRPGAGGNIGLAAVAASPKDGYTLVLLASVNTINVSLTRNAPFDLLKDFTPVGMIAATPLALEVPANSPARSVRELIEYAKKKPGGITFASGGTGSGGHVMAELFKLKTGTPMSHVPYKGGAPAVADIVGGHVDMFFDALPTALPYEKGGKLKVLAITAPKRSDVLPDVPTFTELGMPELESSIWTGLLAPAGTDRDIVVKLNAEMNRALRDDKMVQRFKAIGSLTQPMAIEQFGNYVKAEISRWSEVIRVAGIKGE